MSRKRAPQGLELRRGRGRIDFDFLRESFALHNFEGGPYLPKPTLSLILFILQIPKHESLPLTNEISPIPGRRSQGKETAENEADLQRRPFFPSLLSSESPPSHVYFRDVINSYSQSRSRIW